MTSQSSARRQARQHLEHPGAELQALVGLQELHRAGDGAIAGLQRHARLLGACARVLHHDARRLGNRDGAERHHLAARDDGGQHAFAGAREQDEHHVGGRLLERFQERVGRLHAEQVHSIEDVDLAICLDGRQGRVGHDAAHLLDQIAGSASGSNMRTSPGASCA